MTSMGYLKIGFLPESFITFIIREGHIQAFLSTEKYQLKLQHTIVIIMATVCHIIHVIPMYTNARGLMTAD
jgi:hypothetical protein